MIERSRASPARAPAAWLPLLLKGSFVITPIPTPAPPPLVSLRMTPHLYFAAPGEIVALQIQIEAGAQRVDAAEVIIEFSTAQLTSVDESGLPAGAITPGSGLDIVSWNRVNNERSHHIHGPSGRPSFPDGTFALATMRARVDMGSGTPCCPSVQLATFSMLAAAYLARRKMLA